MPIYVILGNWTDQGTRDFGGAVQRGNGFRGMVEQAGGRVRELVWTMRLARRQKELLPPAAG